ncbi:acyl-ACP--UDP-N-acetylglucosamine O-acyltransferase [Cupriavidus basilensis]|uniref:acyl-ACP--UDP-N-acetylglucosamine O-acyltransferase n=1 Tax=Cupriavidus basilensis TaxID=68895 RepID=UPI0020A6458D|nr:acyl-ACP--UDP-N-acetylglucosamine O-acyltransferase [Cupriavidus basilensis]MCP3018658.1 acyl-ACP--UDP-N-acetylglucosamine O-acyltransferase [Cupriavidus basilensis]MDR3379677.1 acyl-ACP--UDP-N-acetylglucosamine O-acyltransferase [Cupriavidus basilensis]
MTQIHPSALVDPKAELAADVTVGPFSIVGPNVRLGSGTQVGAHTTIEGHTTVGADNRIGPYASVGGTPQDMKYRNEPTRLVIGDRNTIREFTTIHTGTVQDRGVTSIGDDNWVMAYVHIAHDCQVGNHTVFSSNAQIAGHVQVGDWAILGGMSGVHQFVRIGAHAMLGGASALVQDLPPFVIAAGDKGGNKATPHGINVEGMRRRGFDAAQIAALRQAYKVLYKSDLSFEAARNEIAQLIAQAEGTATAALQDFLDFIAATQRGIVR